VQYHQRVSFVINEQNLVFVCVGGGYLLKRVGIKTGKMTKTTFIHSVAFYNVPRNSNIRAVTKKYSIRNLVSHFNKHELVDGTEKWYEKPVSKYRLGCEM